MIIGNVVTDIAGNGISIGKFTASDTTEYHIPYNPTDKNEICTSDTIKDNYIHDVTTEFQGGVRHRRRLSQLLDIEHNEVGYTNYTGISVGYGWTSTVNAMTTNKINNNNIHHVVQIMADGGAHLHAVQSAAELADAVQLPPRLSDAARGRTMAPRASTWTSRPPATPSPTT